MTLDLLFTIAGIATVLLGGYLLVQSAVVIALGYGMARAVVGATVVAFGTSAPELMVGLNAVLRNTDGVSVGNVMGASVANVGLVLGLAAIVNPSVLFTRLRRTAVPILGVAVALFLAVAAGGEIQRWEGVLLLAVLAGVAVLSPRLFPELAAAAGAELSAVERPDEVRPKVTMAHWAQLGGAMVALGVGGHLAVEGAVGLAEVLGLSHVAVGVAIVSVGTCLPEVVTSVLAAVRREYEIAVSNVLGSNIFNLLGVMGTVAIIGVVDVDPGIYRVEAPALVISTVALIPFVMSQRAYRVTRLDGGILLFLYAAYLVLVIDRGL